MKNLKPLLAATIIPLISGCGDLFDFGPYFESKDKVEVHVSSDDGELSYSSTETLFTRKTGKTTAINQIGKKESSTKMSKITGFSWKQTLFTRDQYLDLSSLKKRLAEIKVDLTKTNGDEIKAGETFESEVQLWIQNRVPGSTDANPQYGELEKIKEKTNLKVISFTKAVAEEVSASASTSTEKPQPFIVLEFSADLKDSKGTIYPIKGKLEGRVVLNTI